MTQLEADNALISILGGAAKVAALLGVSIQRVQNWKSRGIPAQMKVNHPDLFMGTPPDRRKARRPVSEKHPA